MADIQWLTRKVEYGVSHCFYYEFQFWSMFYPNCCCINSLAPGRSYCDFKNVIFNLALLIGIFKSSYVNVIRWMPQQFTDDKLTLVQVMAWCRQATSHYLKQSWSRSPTPYGITRPQWVITQRLRQILHHFADNIFIYIFLNKNVRISLKIWLEFVPKGWINNISTLVRLVGAKPLSEAMMIS